jgi:RimJ/RimL family protein N-acetyltransferase
MIKLDIIYPSDIPELKNQYDKMFDLLEPIDQPNENLPSVTAVLRLNDAPVGFMKLFNIDVKNRKAEFGIQLFDKKACRFLPRAFKTFIYNVFEIMQLNRIYAKVHSDNLHVIECAYRMGFTQESIEKESFYQNGIFIDAIVFVLLKRNWKGSG